MTTRPSFALPPEASARLSEVGRSAYLLISAASRSLAARAAGRSAIRDGVSLNNGNRGDGPPDLDELWRDFNRKLSGLFGNKAAVVGRPARSAVVKAVVGVAPVSSPT